MSTLTSCPLLYLLPCRNLVTPIKNVLKSVARKELYPRWLSPVLVRFWGRWGESNSRPEHVSSCFIQPYHNYTLYILAKQIYLFQIPFRFLYSNLRLLNPSIQSSLFSTNIFVGLSSIPIIITSLPTGIPVSSSNATAYAAVCIK